MKFGMLLPSFRHWFELEAARDLVTFCEEKGLDSVWLPDRVIFPADGNEERMLVRPMSTWLKDSQEIQHWGQHGGGYRASENVGECFRDVYVMAGMIAGWTNRMQIGTSVSVVPSRNPIVTARTIATLDRLTNGRFLLGTGSGHILGEFESLNMSFEERHDMLEEWLRCMIALWTQEPASFHGKYYNFDQMRMLIKPVSKPYPPLLMGGQSKRFLRLGAKIGQGWVPAYLKPSELERGIDYMREEMRKEGRTDDPLVTMLLRFRLSETPQEAPPNSRPVYTPAQLAALIPPYEEVGCNTIIAHVPTRDLETMKYHVRLLMDEVKPAVESILASSSK
ncbi:MAG: TIGR03619 family F420-dependent LLM class oxidoreductase [Chloroflexota bacterium]|nr:MAG: TIGR03619 family F420-dependent LLM class oxidoreductase [Chloroflexota bacterium]